MIQYVTYVLSTGEIRSFSRATSFPSTLPAGEAALVVTGPCDPENSFVKNGVITPYPCERPSVFHRWSGSEWFIPIEIAVGRTRAQRDELLQSSDWTQLPDVPLETKTAWATYRQALRDVTDQPGFPLDITWPEPPT